jgi:4-amino-4-deoxy-L-arabinose transferase-like glycosyltransferase
MRFNNTAVLIALFTAGILSLLINITHDGLWNDEAHTALLMRCSFPELLNSLTSDAHPPLYFLGLKAFTLLFGTTVLTLRLFSVAGLLCLALLGIGPVKRLLGTKNGILFSLLCLYLPVSVSFAQEARMYTWICFFVTGMVVYGYFSIVSNRLKDWTVFVLLSIGAMYVHIYGLIIFLMFSCTAFVWILIRRKPLLMHVLLFSTIAFVAYLPWLQVTLAQAARAAGDPWFVTTSIPQIVAPLLLLFADRFLIVNVIPVFVITAVLAYYLFFRAVRLSGKTQEPFPLFAFTVLSCTFTVAVIISLTIAPILMPRYAFTVFGVFLITVLYGIKTIASAKVRMALGILLLLLFFPERIHVHANRINGPLPEIQEYLKNKIDSSQVFLHSNEHTFTTFAWYFPDNIHYLYDPALNVGQRRFTKNGYRINNWQPMVKERIVVWVVNKMETHINKYVSGVPKALKDLDTTLFVKTVESDTFKVMPTWYPGRTYSQFEMNPYWFQVQIARYDRRAGFVK